MLQEDLLKFEKTATRDKKTNWIAHQMLQKIKNKILKVGPTWRKITLCYTITEHDPNYSTLSKYAVHALKILERYFRLQKRYVNLYSFKAVDQMNYVITIEV